MSWLAQHSLVKSKAIGASEIRSWLIDMDGVLVREEHPIEGANRFLEVLRQTETPFLVLTNNSMFTRRDLSARLKHSGLDVPEDHMWTSALATAGFLAAQRPKGSAFVIGEVGLTTALHEVGYTLSENNPDYVVVGETRNYSFESITKAVRLVSSGSRFIATNPDATGPSIDGPLPVTGSVTALISKATGKLPYFIGKPNPLMIRSALRELSAHSETTAMVGDRMDTDVVAGLEAWPTHHPGLVGRIRCRRRPSIPVQTLSCRFFGGRARRRDRKSLAEA